MIVLAKIKTINQLYNASLKVAKTDNTSLYPTLPVVPRKQKNRDSCILINILVIAEYYGIPASEEAIVSAYKDHYKKDNSGTSYSDAFKFLKWLGLKPHWTSSDVETLEAHIRDGDPVMYDIRLKPLGHAVTAVGFDNTYIYFADPYIGELIKIPKRLVDSMLAEESASAISVEQGKNLRLAI